MPLQIRRFEPADLPALQSLLASLQSFVAELDPLGRAQPFADGGASYAAAQLDSLARPGGVVLLSELENEIVGCVLGFVLPDREHRLGLVTELFVRSEYRARGVGRELMATIESEFAAAGCREIQANAYAFNASARGFYEKLGFQPRTIEYLKHIKKPN